MGLDGVELLMEVEESFGFSIPDKDAAALDTAGKLYDYIMANRFAARQPGCLTSVAFYKIRRALMSVLGVPRKEVRLASDLNAIIPKRRRQVWADLHRALGLRLPDLVRPGAVTVLAVLVTCVSGVALGIVVGPCLAFLLILAVAFALYQATKPFAVTFPPKFATVGGLTKSVLQRNYGTISDECQRVSAEDVWRTLRDLIAEQIGVRPDEVTKDSHFVNDLGFG